MHVSKVTTILAREVGCVLFCALCVELFTFLRANILVLVSLITVSRFSVEQELDSWLFVLRGVPIALG